jgi:PAS domain S-box-containing protein
MADDLPPDSLVTRLVRGALRELTVAVGVLAGLSLVVVTWLALARTDAQLERLDGEVRTALAGRVDRSLGGLLELTQRTLVRNALVDSEGRDAYIGATLAEHRGAHPAINGLWLTDHGGRVLAGADLLRQFSLPPDVAQLGRESVDQARPRHVLAEDPTDGWRLYVALPVEFASTGTVEGALVAEIAVETMLGLALAPVDAPFGAQVAWGDRVVSSRGATLSRGPRLDTPIPLPGSLRESLPPLRLSIRQSLWVALSPAIAIGLAYLVAGLGWTWAMRRRIGRLAQRAVQPLQALQDTAAGITRHGLDTLPALPLAAFAAGGAELRSLAQSFDAMLRRLREAQEGLERKVEQRTAELAQAKQRLDSTLASLADGVYSISVDRHSLLFASPPVGALLGLPPGDVPMVRDTMDRVLDATSCCALDGAFDLASLEGMAVATLALPHLDDGQGPRWIQNRMTLVRDEQGRPLRIDGILSDITPTVRARLAREAALADLNLRDRALAATGNGVLILAFEGEQVAQARAVYANAAMAALVALPAAHLVQAEATLLRDALGDPAAFDAALLTCVRQRRDVRLSQRIAGGDGAARWAEITVSPMIDGGTAPGDTRVSHLVLVFDDVTGIRETQADLRLRDRAVNASNNGIVLTDVRSPGQPLVFVNDGFTRVTGYTAEESLGRSCSFLQGFDREQDGIRQLRASVERGEACRVLLRNYRKDGTRFDNDLSIAPVVDEASGEITHFVGVITDVTDRLRAERLLRDQFVRLDTVFALSPDGFVTFDGQGRVASVNPAFERISGLSAGAVAGLSREAFERRLDAVTAERDPAGTAHWRETGADDEDDDLRPAVLADPVPGGARARTEVRVLRGTPQRTVVLSRQACDAPDVSQVLHLRDVTRESEIDRMKSEFLSTAAHELRTPLASIRGFSELLTLRPFDEARTRDMLQTIHRQSVWLSEMINELLDLARIEARRGQDFVLAVHDLRRVVLDGVHALMVPGDAREVRCDLPARLPPVRLDVDKFQHVLGNVLSNAYKYSPGGGEIRLDIRERIFKGRPQVGVRVTDQGIGMSEAHVARAFERFFRADPSGNIPGSGLGLSLCKEILELLGGHVELVSTLGRGTAVTLWLPVWQGDMNGDPSLALPGGQ